MNGDLAVTAYVATALIECKCSSYVSVCNDHFENRSLLVSVVKRYLKDFPNLHKDILCRPKCIIHLCMSFI